MVNDILITLLLLRMGASSCSLPLSQLLLASRKQQEIPVEEAESPRPINASRFKTLSNDAALRFLALVFDIQYYLRESLTFQRMPKL